MEKAQKQQPIIHRIFPFLSWLKTYQAAFLKGDAIAGLTVAVVLIPRPWRMPCWPASRRCMVSMPGRSLL